MIKTGGILAVAFSSYALQSRDDHPSGEMNVGVSKHHIHSMTPLPKDFGLTANPPDLIGRPLNVPALEQAFWSHQSELEGRCALKRQPLRRSTLGPGATLEIQLWCASRAVEGAGLWAYIWNDRVTGVKFQLSDASALHAAISDEWTALSDDELFAINGIDGTATAMDMVWHYAAEQWRLVRLALAGDEWRKQLLWLDAATGERLAEADWGFHATGRALVFQRNDSEPTRSWQDLTGLRETGYLDGEHFDVHSPSEFDPRVYSSNLEFAIEPTDGRAFDQVQTYYNLTRGLDWLSQHLGFRFTGPRIKVRVHALIGGIDPDNGQYVPTHDGSAPEIQLGAGGRVLRNLSRDSDVALHEFMHHLVYQFIDTRVLAPALALHEGFADYFTYAINGDPYLAETTLPGKPYLRTALLDAERRFDNPYIRRSPHDLGEIWSAFLWKARQGIGPSFDKVVYRSLEYLDRNSDFEDAILALLSADRDLQPLATGDREFGLFGTAKCVLLGTAVERGFQEFVRTIDGNSCGLDLTSVTTPKFSRPRDSDLPPEQKPLSCGVITGSTDQSGMSILFLIMSLLLPTIYVVRRAGCKVKPVSA
jgi:hypothetical protein